MSVATPLSPREQLAAALSLVPRAIRAAWVGGIVLPIGLGLTIAWALSTPHLYRSETVIAYERGVRSTAIGASEGDLPHEVGQRLRERLMSRQRLEGAIKEMNLYRATVERHSLAEAIDEMTKHITFSAREGFTYRVAFDGAGRDVAQQVLTWLVKSVIDEDTKRRIKEADETKGFLDAERQHADLDLKSKETALASFLAKHPQLTADSAGGGAATGGAIRVAELASTPASSSEIAALELQAAQFEEALVAAGARPAPAPGGGSTADPALIAARARALADLQTAQQDLIDKQAHFTNEHPDVKLALGRVDRAEAALRRVDSLLGAERNAEKNAETSPSAPAGAGGAGAGAGTGEDSDMVSSRTAALRHALSAVRSQIAALRTRGAARQNLIMPQSSVVAIDNEWTRLNRDVAAAREQQAQLESKQFQAQLMATLVSGGQGGRLVIADPPFRPMHPITGGRFKIAALGLGLSIFASLLAIIVFAVFDDRLYDTGDINRIVKDGIVVVIPKLTGKSG